MSIITKKYIEMLSKQSSWNFCWFGYSSDSAGNNSGLSDIVQLNFENVWPTSHYDQI